MSDEKPIKLNDDTQELLDEVNRLYPTHVFVQFHGKKSGYVRHDQAEQTVLPGGLFITVTDLTEPNYTVSHELLHLLMVLRGFPEIFFELSLGSKELDEQMTIMATDLYNVIAHRVVVSEQRKHNLINERIEQEYMKGILHTLTDEGKKDDDERTLRLLTILDALVFYGDHLPQYEDQLKEHYPKALAAAKKLYAQITEKPVDSPFGMRRMVVKLFRIFDEQMQDWDLPKLNNNKFTTLSPVLSKRQLRLNVDQIYDIYHSGMNSRETGRKAYVGLAKGDHQNSFVISAPKGDYSSNDMLKFYHEPVETLLKHLNVPFIVRE